MPALMAAALVVLCEGLCFGAILPVIDKYNAALGGGPIVLGLLFALVSGPKVLTNPFFGRLSDRIGRRPVLTINTLGTLAGSVMWALSPNLWWLAASRAVTGIFGAQAALASAVAADVTPLARRAAGMAVLGAAFGLSVTLGPLVGAIVGHYVSDAAVGWACASLQLASLLIIALALPETRAFNSHADVQPLRAGAAPARSDQHVSEAPAGDSPTSMTGTPLRYWRGPVAPLMAVTLVMWTGFSAMNGTYQLVTRDVYGFDEKWTGCAFAVLGIVGVLVQGGAIRPIVARFGEYRPGLIGIGLLVAAFALIASRPPLWAFWMATVLLGIGSALIVPCLSGLISRRVSDREQGAALGLQQGMVGVGRAGGAALGGGLYALGGPALTYGAAGVLLAVSAGLLAGAREHPPARAPG